MVGREFVGDTVDRYRFGFNGKVKDDEINVDGGSYDFGARIYDGRLGRWLSSDPLQEKYPNVSPYNFSMNNPIYFIDPDGKKIKPANDAAEEYIYNSLLSIFKNADIVGKLFDQIDGAKNLKPEKGKKDGKINPDYDPTYIIYTKYSNLNQRRFNKMLKSLGKTSGVKFSKGELKTAYAWYSKINQSETVEVLATNKEGAGDGTAYDQSMENKSVKSQVAITSPVLQVISVEMSSIPDKAENKTGDKFDKDKSQAAMQTYLDTKTHNTGIFVSADNSAILIDTHNGVKDSTNIPEKQNNVTTKLTNEFKKH